MGCTHDCNQCAGSCHAPESLQKEPHKASTIRKVIGIVSGKGGVGKSLVTSMLATAVARRGKHTAILDADITGPSIPKAFGLHDRLMMGDEGVEPAKTRKYGIDVVSINLALENENDPVVYRGPILAQTVDQFWQEVVYKDVDFMFVDMPPGTGDVPLTVYQSLPIDAIVIMTSPQSLVSMVVGKAVKMAQMMNIPILGIIENYSYFACPDCGKTHTLFGESHVTEIAQQHHIDVLAKLPMDPRLAAAVDAGAIEDAVFPEEINKTVDAILALEKNT